MQYAEGIKAFHCVLHTMKGAAPMAVQRVIEQDPDTAINETPGVMGGYPCVGRTRISVAALVEARRIYGSVEAVVDYFPQLTRAQVDAGLAYYDAHPARVDEDIERYRQAEAEEFAAHHTRS